MDYLTLNDSERFHPDPRYGKGRSKSICAPQKINIETVISPPEIEYSYHDGSPPTYQRSKSPGPGRSPSPREVGVRKRSSPNLQVTYVDELFNGLDTPPQQRRKSAQGLVRSSSGSNKPPPSPTTNASPYSAAGRRKSNAYLDVPFSNYGQNSDEDEETVTLRTFSSSNKGVINRGDSFRRRRSRSASLIPPSSPLRIPEKALPIHNGPDDSYLVAMLGANGVGKAALVSQFKTSECINAYDGGGRESPNDEENISIVLDGKESELNFMLDSQGNKELIGTGDAFLVIYSVVDKSSFSRAEEFLNILQEMDLLRSNACILVGNKIDLARSRAVSTQAGKCLACTYRTKFIEISVGINHNVDELLAGTLKQIRLKKEKYELQGDRDYTDHWYKNRTVVRASMKARQMITWIFGKEDSRFRNCSNLQVI